METLQKMNGSEPAKVLGWGQELDLTKDGVDMMAQPTRTEAIFSKLSANLDLGEPAIAEVENALKEIGQVTTRSPVEVVAIDDAEKGEEEKEKAPVSVEPEGKRNATSECTGEETGEQEDAVSATVHRDG